MGDTFSLSVGCTVPGRICQISNTGEVWGDDIDILFDNKPCVRQDLGLSNYRCGNAFIYTGYEERPLLSYITGHRKGALRFLSEGGEIAKMQVLLPAQGRRDSSYLRQALLAHAKQLLSEVQDEENRQVLQSTLKKYGGKRYARFEIPPKVKPWLEIFSPDPVRQEELWTTIKNESTTADEAVQCIIRQGVERWMTIWNTMGSYFIEEAAAGEPLPAPVFRWWEQFAQETLSDDFDIESAVAKHGGVTKTHRELREVFYEAMKQHADAFAVLATDSEVFVPLLAESGDPHYATALAFAEGDPETQINRLIDIIDRLPATVVANKHQTPPKRRGEGTIISPGGIIQLEP